MHVSCQIPRLDISGKLFAGLLLGEFLEDEKDWKERASGLLMGGLYLDPKVPCWSPSKFFVLCDVQVKNMSL